MEQVAGKTRRAPAASRPHPACGAGGWRCGWRARAAAGSVRGARIPAGRWQRRKPCACSVVSL